MKLRLPGIVTKWLRARILPISRPCDFRIGSDSDPYMLRWYLIPRNPIANVYLHHILRSDDDRALHDHPWPSVSIVLDGSAVEHVADDGSRMVGFSDVVFRGSRFAHRLEIPAHSEGLWTLFLTGPRMRVWGFHCPKGWRPWFDFLDSKDKGKVGNGCDP